MKLFRAMTPAANGLPATGRSARQLGIRTAAESMNDPDVTATAPDEIIQPGTGGMSATPDDPKHLPPFRRPAALGGRGKDPVWVIDTDDLGPELQFRQDGPTHGQIEPTQPMTLAEYEAALAATVVKWTRQIG